MKILGTICARGGSKGVPGKNIKMLNGKPLIAYTIEQALKWDKLYKLIVSTDDEEIAEVAKQYGAEVPFIRPEELATDSAGKLEVIKHAVKYLEDRGEVFDIVIDMDVTAPLRKIEDLEGALNVLLQKNANNVYTVCEAHKNPYFNMVELDINDTARLSKTCGESQILSRQVAPKVYDMNASIYIYKKDFLLKTESIHSDNTMIYVMPQERSIDIDTPLDFKFVEFLLKEGAVEID